MTEKVIIENCIILLMAIAGSGKRTVGEELCKMSNFKLAHHHYWTDPIVRLLGDDSSVWWTLTDPAWGKLNEARDVVFSTMTDVCPPSSSFVITFEMLDGDPWHKIFYDRVLDVVAKKKAIFLPVRLLCNEMELLDRVQSDDRKKYFKTHDVDLIRDRVRTKKVYFSGHDNEITINNTSMSPVEVSQSILDHLQKKLK